MAKSERQQILEALQNRQFALARRLLCATKSPSEQDLLLRGLAELGDYAWREAEQTFSLLLTANPSAQNYLNLAITQENLGKTQEALTAITHALALHPNPTLLPGAYLNQSNLNRKLGKTEDAKDSALKAIALGAAKGEGLNALALAYGKEHDYAEAEETLDEALTLDPQNPIYALNRANLATDQLHFEEAWLFFAKARAVVDSDLAKRDEAMARLLAGQYEIGFPLYESRLPLLTFPKPSIPRYDNQSLKGKKLLIVAEQGFGDTIHFCRFDALLQETGADITWCVQSPLVSLLQNNMKGRVVSTNDPFPEADFYLPLLSLPLALKCFTPFGDAPYLRATAKQKLEGEKKIGLVWRGSKTHQRDDDRSIHPSFFNPLFEKFPEATFYAPFPDSQEREGLPIIDLAPFIKDFSDTAAFLVQLDALITVDTAVAHLAGALGIKTYLLLPYCPDWRWGTLSDKTPWYPSMTLLRQQRPGEWDDSILDKVSVY